VIYILVWIVFGLIVGAIAKLLMPGRDPGGCIITILLGVAGSFVGGFIGRSLGVYDEAVSAGGFFMSILGAVVLLAIYRLLTGRRRSRV
jgi:uncharacterized membrane protein YeaQ/YmgE (transglycosylase-associated protein family)